MNPGSLTIGRAGGKLGPISALANGGIVRGPGTGTSDSIRKTVPAGSFIMPADSTRKLGAAALRDIGKPSKVRLSNGEFELPPEAVYALGAAVLRGLKDATHTPVSGLADGGFVDPGTLSDDQLAASPHRDLIMMRYRNADPAVQQRLAPFEHRAFAREQAEENPLHLVAQPAMEAIYQGAKGLGLMGARTPADLNQLKQTTIGAAEGAGTWARNTAAGARQLVKNVTGYAGGGVVLPQSEENDIAAPTFNAGRGISEPPAVLPSAGPLRDIGSPPAAMSPGGGISVTRDANGTMSFSGGNVGTGFSYSGGASAGFRPSGAGVNVVPASSFGASPTAAPAPAPAATPTSALVPASRVQVIGQSGGYGILGRNPVPAPAAAGSAPGSLATGATSAQRPAPARVPPPNVQAQQDAESSAAVERADNLSRRQSIAARFGQPIPSYADGGTVLPQREETDAGPLQMNPGTGSIVPVPALGPTPSEVIRAQKMLDSGPVARAVSAGIASQPANTTFRQGNSYSGRDIAGPVSSIVDRGTVRAPRGGFVAADAPRDADAASGAQGLPPSRVQVIGQSGGAGILGNDYEQGRRLRMDLTSLRPEVRAAGMQELKNLGATDVANIAAGASRYGSDTARYGVDVGAGTAHRGQDIGAVTAAAGRQNALEVARMNAEAEGRRFTLADRRAVEANDLARARLGIEAARIGRDGAPSGYRWRADGTGLEAIHGGPHDTATKAGQPLNENQSNALNFASRMHEADRILSGLAQAGVNPSFAQQVTGGSGVTGRIATALASPEQQQAEQAQRDYVNATLRRESGAAISDSEFESARRQYFAQPGDSPEVLAQKARNRQLAMRGILAAVPDGERRMREVIGTGNEGRPAIGHDEALGELRKRAASNPQLAAKLAAMGY